MSNNLVSQQLPVPTRQLGQFKPLSSELDSSVSRMQTEMMIPVSNNFVPQQLAALSQQMGSVGSMGNNLGSRNIAVSKQMGQTVTKESDMGRQQVSSSNQQYGQVGVSMTDTGPQQLLLPSKRKADVEPIYTNSMSLQTSIANKRAAQMEHSPKSTGLSQFSAANKKILQVQPSSVSPGSQNLPASNKKMLRNESISNKAGSQRVQTSKGRSTQMEPSPKIHTELSEAVRSKMRESLAAALALVAQNQDKGANEKQHSPDEAASSPKRKQEDSFKPADSTSMASDVSNKVHENSADMPLKESSGAEKPSDTQNRSADAPTNDSFHESVQTFNYDAPVFHYSDILPNEDVPFSDNFFVKDELLQVNGLSWAFDLDMQMTEAKGRRGENPKPGHDALGQDGGEQASNSSKDVDIKDESEMVHSPQDLAFKIETELFKLFGGVNKKYKEKGRSLLFNLKDRNNPELRERVMSGEIPPERLCSMTAEELASKELSQWRMAKAEELAQMVVLPDTDVDIRRLVKKTHKGEYQVEVEKDDSYEAEVSAVSSLTHNRPKRKSAARPSSEADDAKDRENVMGDKDKSDNQNPSYRLTIPNDGMDLMQGLMVDDMKDAEFLPPIVSLDEFMESLDSEPPFENLPVGTELSSPSDKGKSGSGKETVVSSPAKAPSDIAMSKTDKVDGDNTEPQSNVKSIQSPVKRKTSIAVGASMSDQVWQGAVQLNISSLVTVVGLYKSGEKTSTKEWPSSLEIKGRVRLDAFEKFLQELPMSRSRAVMVVHFIMEEESSESDRASLCEVVDSYVLEDRLGFAEPAPGVELYLCPPHPKILDLLSRHLPKDQTQTLNSTHSGLIGVVVWRRIHVSSSAVSPNSSSHHKHCSKRQNFTSRRQQDKDSINVNPNLSSKLPGKFCTPAPSQPPPDDEDDDIPPGFGPAASSRVEDDLPEFNFSGNVNSSASRLNAPRGSRKNPSRPTLQGSSRDQVRELIHKYGQIGNDASPRNWQDGGGFGIQIEPWNDDDDDIPEWQGPQQQPKPQPPIHGFQQPPVRQQMRPIGAPLQHLTNMVAGPQTIPPPWQEGAGRAQPPASKSTQPTSLVAGQYHGAPMPTDVNWRQDARRSRGF